jgi:hypothetical protein|tara:strand:- start:1889 stop:2095 length:207 start_codon:yes stop_codon:yes gene_type:complete
MKEDSIILRHYLTFKKSSEGNISCYTSRIIFASSIDEAKARLMSHSRNEDDVLDDFDAIPCEDLILKM